MIARILDQVSDLFSRNIYSYCQLLTKSENCQHTLICTNGDCLTFFEIDGNYKFLTPESESVYIEDFHNAIETNCESVGHEVEFYLVRDNERTDDYLNSVYAGTINTIESLNMRSADTIKKQRDDLKDITVYERCLMVIVTKADSFKIDDKNKPPALLMPASEYTPLAAQSPYQESKDLINSHQSFTSTFSQVCSDYLALEKLTSNTALTYLLEEATHNIHHNVEFIDNEDSIDIEYNPTELEYFSAPPLSYQIMSEQLNPTSDRTIIERCGRYYAPMSREHFPTRKRTFTDLISQIDKEVNFRFNYSLKFGSQTLKNQLSSRKSILSFLYFSPNIKSNSDAIDQLIRMCEDNDVVLSGGAMSITTWSNSLEQTKKFRKKIQQTMIGWGNTQVATGTDIYRGYLSTLPAYSNKKSGRYSVQPLYKHLTQLPFNRTCVPMRSGGMCFSSLDGKPFPIQNFPDSQKYTLNTVLGNMGGGKTVLLSLIQDSYLWTAGNATIPLCGYLDWGSGVQNCIKAIKVWLPERLHYLATCIDVKNKNGSAINYLEPPFGFNSFVDSVEDFRFATRFTSRIINGNQQTIHSQLLTFVEQLLKEMADKFSKKHQPYSRTISRYVNDERELHNEINALLSNGTISFNATDQRSWWIVRDKLFMLDSQRYIDHARFCHRQGSPTLNELNITLLQSRTLKEKMDGIKLDNGTPLFDVCKSTLGAVLERFGDIFGQPSQIDVSQARVVGVNLKEVVTSQTDIDSQTDNKLFGLLGKYLISRNFWRDQNDFMAATPPLYYDMYKDQIKNDMSGIKSQIIDEMGKLKSDEMFDLLSGDADVARKYRLCTTIAGQSVNQFPVKVIDKSSNIYLLDGSVNDIALLKERFDLSASFTNLVHKYVGKPVNNKGRALLFIGKYDNYRGNVCQILNNYITPSYLWHFSSDQIDMDIKELVAKRFGSVHGLQLLAQGYPTGTIKKYVKERLDIAAKKHQSLTEIEVLLEIVEHLIIIDNG